MIPVHSHKGKYSNSVSGAYYPIHPEKFKGCSLPIYKSRLELRAMMYLDKNPSIISWSYEPKPIRYLDKSCNPPAVRRYFVDFIATAKVNSMLTKTIWIEVKCKEETLPPKNRNNIENCKIYLK